MNNPINPHLVMGKYKCPNGHDAVLKEYQNIGGLPKAFRLICKEPNGCNWRQSGFEVDKRAFDQFAVFVKSDTKGK